MGAGAVVLGSGLGLGLLRSRWADKVRRESLVALSGLDGVGELPSEREYQTLESLADLPVEIRLAALERVLESEVLRIRLENRLQFVLHAIVGLDVEMDAKVQWLIEHSEGRTREEVSSALDALHSSEHSIRLRAAPQASALDDTLAHAVAPRPVDEGHRTRAEALARQMVLGRRSRLSQAFAQPDLPKVSFAFAEASLVLSPGQAADVARLVLKLLTTTALLEEVEALAEALGELGARMEVKDCIATLKAIPCVGHVRIRFIEGARNGVAPGIGGHVLELVTWAKGQGVEPGSVRRF